MVGRRELMIGCGNRRGRILQVDGHDTWNELVTLDVDPACHPDHVHDLNELPLPFPDEDFDEIHAYEVLEHVGRQGDFRFFFAQFADFWRVLRPDGALMGSCPALRSAWLWGDPGHTRVITQDRDPDADFKIPLPQPEEAANKVPEPADAQDGSDADEEDGADVRHAGNGLADLSGKARDLAP